MENEKDFKPYAKNSKYLVSRNGDVYSLKSKKILTHRIDSGGYHMITMRVDGKRKNVWVHRMVAETFIENPENLKYVNHIDEDKSNNAVDNLEWCNNSYNNQSIRKKKIERLKEDDVRFVRENHLRACVALIYLHNKGYTVCNKCARQLVKGITYKNIK